MPFESLGGLAAVAGLVGLCVGSFLNVVIHRLPKMMEQEWQAQCADLRGETPSTAATLSLARPRSRCPSCGHQITALENIPLLSYLLLRGKCSNCAAPISPRYPVIEAVTALLSAYAAWHFGPTLQAAGALLQRGHLGHGAPQQRILQLFEGRDHADQDTLQLRVGLQQLQHLGFRGDQ